MATKGKGHCLGGSEERSVDDHCLVLKRCLSASGPAFPTHEFTRREGKNRRPRTVTRRSADPRAYCRIRRRRERNFGALRRILWDVSDRRGSIRLAPSYTLGGYSIKMKREMS